MFENRIKNYLIKNFEKCVIAEKVHLKEVEDKEYTYSIPSTLQNNYFYILEEEKNKKTKIVQELLENFISLNPSYQINFIGFKLQENYYFFNNNEIEVTNNFEKYTKTFNFYKQKNEIYFLFDTFNDYEQELLKADIDFYLSFNKDFLFSYLISSKTISNKKKSIKYILQILFLVGFFFSIDYVLEETNNIEEEERVNIKKEEMRKINQLKKKLKIEKEKLLFEKEKLENEKEVSDKLESTYFKYIDWSK